HVSSPTWRIKNKRGKRLRNDKARSRTRVNIGSAFQRWRELKERRVTPGLQLLKSPVIP
uniref:Uncharacterized protein n=1 Tax=Sinocyclocheilus rhinocerous TaxID=307959 RepID=A0A673GHT8_9TELE